jgi:hypothetical protein
MILLSLAGAFLHGPVLATSAALSGIVALAAVVLLIVDVRKLLMMQAICLIVIGIVLMFAAAANGQQVDWLDALSRNTILLSMVVGVGLLRLVMLDFTDPDSVLPMGKRAFRRTMLAVGVFGSIINISGPVLIADRLSTKKSIDLYTASVLTRIFSACAAWSPFFGGMAVVLVYTQSASLGVLMLHGLPFFVVSFCVVYGLGVFFHAQELELFEGYPIALNSLWAPAMLSVIVFLIYWLFPQVPILIVIIAASVFLPFAYLLVRRGVRVLLDRFGQYINTELCKSQNELLLFMAAGILASGLSHYVNSVDFALPSFQFDIMAASILLAIMVLVAACGIHPVIQIALLTPLLQPLSPPANLLGMVYLFSWSLGTCASPLSGTHLIIQGRYGIPAWRGAMQNWPYVFSMYWVAVAILYSLS